MRRLVAFAVIASLGNVPAAFAGESLLAVATRVTRDATAPKADRKDEPRAPKPLAPSPVLKDWTTALAQEQPAISTSSMRKRTKVMIFIGAAAAFAATAYTIDHKVEDNTPSSHGLRED
jgi:hypothetical protein